MAVSTIAFVMGGVEPRVETWCTGLEDVSGGMMEDSMVPIEWSCGGDDDDNELNIGWMNPQTLLQVHSVEVPTAACHEIVAPESSLPTVVEAQWLDARTFIDKINMDLVAVVPDDFMYTCQQAQDQAINSQSDWLEDLNDVDSFLKQLEYEQVNPEPNPAAVSATTVTADNLVCSQLELLLRSKDASSRSPPCSEVDTDVDIELESIVDQVPDDSESDESSDDSDWSYNGKKCRRRSSGRKGGVRQYTRYRQLTSVAASSVVIRKKEQNKTAATRYRERKRTEEQDNEVECLALEKRNKELRSRVSEMTHEVAVLRQLIVDIFRTSPA